MIPAVLLVAVSISLTSLAHVLLKSGADGAPGYWGSLLARRTLSAYVLLGAAALSMVFALAQVPLMTYTLWASLGYPLVALLSRVLLKERLRPRTLLGTACIVASIVLYTTLP